MAKRKTGACSAFLRTKDSPAMAKEETGACSAFLRTKDSPAMAKGKTGTNPVSVVRPPFFLFFSQTGLKNVPTGYILNAILWRGSSVGRATD